MIQNKLTTLYFAMGVWLVLASVFRLVIQVTHNQPLDALPFISATLGFVAILTHFAPSKDL